MYLSRLICVIAMLYVVVFFPINTKINENYLIVGLGFVNGREDRRSYVKMYRILLAMGFILLGHAAYSAVQCEDTGFRSVSI